MIRDLIETRGTGDDEERHAADTDTHTHKTHSIATCLEDRQTDSQTVRQSGTHKNTRAHTHTHTHTKRTRTHNSYLS